MKEKIRFKRSAFELLTDPDKQKAAAVLGSLGYRKGSRRRNGAIMNAARAAGVSVQTLWNWLAKPEFLAAIFEMTSRMELKCITNLEESAAKGNPTAAIYLLKVLDPERYDDSLRKELILLKAKAAQLQSMLEQYPVPMINLVAPAGPPPETPEELKQYLQ